MSAAWRVHLSPDAEAMLRDADRAAAGRIGAALDRLGREGRSCVTIDEDGPEWSGGVSAGDHRLLVAGRAGDARIVVVRIARDDEHPAQHVVDVLPLKLSARRKVGSFLQGADLDLRYTLRALRRAPVYAIVVMATLAIGFGGGAALLDVVHTVYGRALPFAEGGQLVRVRNANVSATGETRRYNLTPSDFRLAQAANRSFREMLAMEGRSLSLLGVGPAERVSAIGVSEGWARTLGLRPILGRAFSPDEEAAGRGAPVAMISHSLWMRRFGADSAAVGAALRYDGGVLTIVGVLGPGINYPYDADVWTPWSFDASNSAVSNLNVVARLGDGTTLEGARADGQRLHEARKAANPGTTATAFDVATLRSDFIRDEARTLQALTAAVLFLIVLACVNVANLLVARFTTRRSELALRAALGGSREQQVRQMLLESTMLFAGGALGGVLLSGSLRQLLGVTIPGVFRTQLGFAGAGVGAGVVAATVATALVCGIVIGVVAARRAAKADAMPLVRQGGRPGTTRGDRRVFDLLVGAQLSFSLVLLVGASLLIGRFREMSAQHPGYELADVATLRVTLEHERYRAADARARLVSVIEERLASRPGVRDVGITSVNPLCCGDWGAAIEIEGRPPAPNDPPTLVAHSYVSPGYFKAMSIRVLRGRGFEPADRADAPLTVVVDEEFARMAWPGEEPIGKRVRRARPGQEWRTVVGIVPVTSHEAEMRASWFLPYLQDATGPSGEQLHIMVRHSGGVSIDQLRAGVAEIDPALAVYGTNSMEALQRDRTAQDRLGALVSGVFALFGLVLAGFSLYGLLSYSVELRRAELGVRLALGASRGAILSLVLRQAAWRLAAGLLAGVGLAFGLNHLLRTVVVGLPWVPWQTLLALAGAMTAVTALAAVVPAVRAMRVDPIRSLRA